MSQHAFILKPGFWAGEGKIILSMVEEFLPFHTTWHISPKDNSGKIQCVQDIQIQGFSEMMRNDLLFSDFTGNHFCIEMQNPNIGHIIGQGVVDDKIIAWEFRENDLHFEGFESYKQLDDGSYQMHGEYISADQFRTQIEGALWFKPENTKPSS
jgi:hypothetical protein